MLGKCMLSRPNIERTILKARHIKDPRSSRMFYAPKDGIELVASLASMIEHAPAARDSHVLTILERIGSRRSKLGGDIRPFIKQVREEKRKFSVTETGLEQRSSRNPFLNDLDKIRESIIFQALVWHIRSISKADRHCHLSASISREYIYKQLMQWDEAKADLFIKKNPPPKSPGKKESLIKKAIKEEIQNVKSKMGSGTSWKEAWEERADKIRDIVFKIESTGDFDISILDKNDFLKAFAHVIENYVRDGVYEVNIRFKPQKDYCSTTELLEALNSLCDKLEKKHKGLLVKYVFCYNRENFSEDTYKLQEYLDEINGLPRSLKERLVKIDLSGQEVSFHKTTLLPEQRFYSSNFMNMSFYGYPVMLHLNDPGYMRGPEKDGKISWIDRLKAHHQFMADTMRHIGKVDSIGHLWGLLPSKPGETPIIVKGGNLAGTPITGTFKKEANSLFKAAKASHVMFEQLPIIYDSDVMPAVAKYMFAPFYYWVKAGLPFERITTGIDNTMYGKGMTLSETIAFFMLFSPESKKFSYKNILGMATRNI